MSADQLSFLIAPGSTQEAIVAPALTALTPLHRALDAFHSHMVSQNMSEHTVKAFDSDLRLLARYLGNRSIVGHIGTEDLVRFIDYLRRERGVPCNLKSMARRITTLKVFFAWLEDEQVIANDPAAPLIHRRAHTPLPRVLSESEVAQLRTAAAARREDHHRPDARPYLLTSLLLATGIKKSECMSLAPEDIVTSTSAGPSLFVRYDSPKQRHKERRLRLPADISSVVDEYLTQYRPSSRLFECTPRNLEYVLDNLAKRVQLPARRVSFELLRWTCAFQDFVTGMDEDTLRRKLGLSRITWAETLDKLQRLAAPAL